MDADELVNLLRGRGITVHAASPLPRAANGRAGLAVFLDPPGDQREAARVGVVQLPGVASVTFSGFTPWVMFVTFTSAGLSSAAWR
ncbi:hypothetical protein KIH74_29770 [Kineosporia sp. J2-2]|uniref:Uncharacterized protein n=1 Tax=Kineosporia corallincola TaxID=2835133 RepID=A0ABS5TRA8_9ACTN|nr:hypothetical protein [Kineosporia corallincola]MBT0773169.1 hypothetical protein [Kineosporia corallincola]